VRDLTKVRQRPAFRSILSGCGGKVAANARELAIVRLKIFVSAQNR
jgi:hypothetical protein